MTDEKREEALREWRAYLLELYRPTKTQNERRDERAPIEQKRTLVPIRYRDDVPKNTDSGARKPY